MRGLIQLHTNNASLNQLTSELERKEAHLNHAVGFHSIESRVFEDICLVHNCLPEIDFDEIRIDSHLGQIKLAAPIIINAITGGTGRSHGINKCLSSIAGICNIPMAVGSQKIAFRDKSVEKSFQIVRKNNPYGVVFANLPASIEKNLVRAAVDMVEANAVQLHLNAPQELIMAEGDRNFSGILKNIAAIVEISDVPVIVKEVGFGIAKEQAKKLLEAGVSVIDISGRGGTNFIKIETERRSDKVGEHFKEWGIPTAASLLEIKRSLGDIELIASGGLRTGLDVLKALILGAKATAFAGHFIYILLQEGKQALVNEIEKIIQELKIGMLLVGARDVSELKYKDYVIGGATAQWLIQRGLNLGAKNGGLA